MLTKFCDKVVVLSLRSQAKGGLRGGCLEKRTKAINVLFKLECSIFCWLSKDPGSRLGHVWAKLGLQQQREKHHLLSRSDTRAV